MKNENRGWIRRCQRQGNRFLRRGGRKGKGGFVRNGGGGSSLLHFGRKQLGWCELQNLGARGYVFRLSHGRWRRLGLRFHQRRDYFLGWFGGGGRHTNGRNNRRGLVSDRRQSDFLRPLGLNPLRQHTALPQSLECLQHLSERHLSNGLNCAKQGHLQIHPFVGRPFHLLFAGGAQINELQKAFPRHSGALGLQSLDHRAPQLVLQPAGISLSQQQVAQMSDQVAQQLSQIPTRLRLFVDQLKGLRGILREDCLTQIAHLLPRGEAKHRKHVLLLDRVAAKGHELVQHGFRVAHPAVRSDGHGKRSLLRKGHPLLLGDVQKVSGDDGRTNPLEVKTLAARKDRRRQFLDVSRGEEKLHMGGRLLQSLKQGVKRPGGKHVHLIHQVDLEARPRREVLHVVDDDVPHLVHLSVRGRVKLQHVHRIASGHFNAGITLPAGSQRRPGTRVAIKRLGQNPSSGGLSGPPGTYEQIGMRKPVLQNRVFQRLRDMLLPDDIVKCLGAVFPGKDRVAHLTTMRAPARICQRRESYAPINAPAHHGSSVETRPLSHPSFLLQSRPP